VGAGLSRFPGSIWAIPFTREQGTSPKDGRQNARGLGPGLGLKGLEASNSPSSAMHKFIVPDNVTRPALASDYLALENCLEALDGGLLRGDAAQFLYCSFLVPHPPYQSNATYMAAVADLQVGVPKQVPLHQLHPNDVATITLRGSMATDLVPNATKIHFRKVYFSMCFEADVRCCATLPRSLDHRVPHTHAPLHPACPLSLEHLLRHPVNAFP